MKRIKLTKENAKIGQYYYIESHYDLSGNIVKSKYVLQYIGIEKNSGFFEFRLIETDSRRHQNFPTVTLLDDYEESTIIVYELEGEPEVFSLIL